MKNALLASAAVVGLWAGSAWAVLIPLPAFTGTTSETFESFNNYNIPVPVTHMTEPVSILVNAAQLTSASADLTIYEPSAGATFNQFDLGFAPVHDGVKALGLDFPDSTGTITFASKISAIGGYWGAAQSVGFGLTPDITFTFYNGATPVGTTSLTYAGGPLVWGGWFSTTPFDRFTFAGDIVELDGLQSDAAPVPEPASATAILLSVALLGVRRCRA